MLAGPSVIYYNQEKERKESKKGIIFNFKVHCVAVRTSKMMQKKLIVLSASLIFERVYSQRVKAKNILKNDKIFAFVRYEGTLALLFARFNGTRGKQEPLYF